MQSQVTPIFYVMDKALSGELSCARTSLVFVLFCFFCESGSRNENIADLNIDYCNRLLCPLFYSYFHLGMNNNGDLRLTGDVNS